ncbi:tachylectin-related carbohydrate-binding protein [Actinoplanes sp. CA-030573]|uniref:tachylectin-related carbohydrate-binding protein n=1 Tax=Actinoplanes sp. CA-030573 TaxID=3239898 RepID=UPI003D90D3F6
MNSYVARWRRAAVGLAAALTATPLLLAVGGPAQAADTFQCTGGATLLAAETGGKLWKYPFTSPGTTSSKLGTRVSIGSGWNTYGRVLGGPDGRVYGINSTGLWRYRYNGSGWDTVNGSQKLQISTSFTQYATASYRNKITVDEIGDFYLVDGNGKLRWYRYDETTRQFTVNARVIDTGWDRYDLIVAAGPGVLFARTPAGELYRYRFEPVSQRWLTVGARVGTGWNGFTKGIFSTGGDTLTGIQADGDLITYRYREDTNSWPVLARDIDNGWQTFANAGAFTDTCRLTDRHVPASTATPVAQYSPSAVVQGPAGTAAVGPVEYLHADNIGRLRHAYQSNPDVFSSAQWTTLNTDQAFTGKPAVVANGQGNLQALVHNANGDIWSFTRAASPSTTWQAGISLGGAMRSAPALVKLSDGTLAAFAVDANGQLWYRSQDGTAGDLLPWRPLTGGGTGNTGDPYVLATSDQSALLVVADAAGTLRTATYRAGALSAWTSLGGSGFTGTPSIVTVPGPSLRIFARTADGQIVTQRQNAAGAFPGVWDAVGDFVAAGPPAAVLDPVLGRIAVVARGADGEIHLVFETAQGSGTWGAWQRLNPDTSDPAATDPAAIPFTNSSGQTWLIAFRNANDATRVYERTQVSGTGTSLRRSAAAPGFIERTLPALPAG